MRNLRSTVIRATIGKFFSRRFGGNAAGSPIVGVRPCRLQFRVLRNVVLKESCTQIHGSYRDAIRSLTGSDPVPGSTNLGACELAGLGLKNGGSGDEHRHHFFPFVGTDHCHSRDMVGVFLEKSHFIPARLPIRSLHLRKIRQDSDRPRSPFLNEKFAARMP
jgi:hypothetical protein